jgi:hypothetical protein
MLFFSVMELRFTLNSRHMLVIQLYNLPFCGEYFKWKGIINACSFSQVSLQTLAIKHSIGNFR